MSREAPSREALSPDLSSESPSSESPSSECPSTECPSTEVSPPEPSPARRSRPSSGPTRGAASPADEERLALAPRTGTPNGVTPSGLSPSGSFPRRGTHPAARGECPPRPDPHERARGARSFAASPSRPLAEPSPPERESPARERGWGPRERLWQEGAGRLSDAELVAVLLGTGSPRAGVESLAVDLLGAVGGLAGLAPSHPRELGGVEGVGDAKAARILAAVELGRRVSGRPWRRGTPFLGSQQVYEHYAPRLRDERREWFIAAYLDVRRRLLGEEVVSIGSLVASIVHPREVFRPAVRLSAASVIVVHNHPSGDPTPSAEDWAVTDRLRRAGETLGIELLDHLVLGEGAWSSLRGDGDR